jgi:hypothetical protein
VDARDQHARWPGASVGGTDGWPESDRARDSRDARTQGAEARLGGGDPVKLDRGRLFVVSMHPCLERLICVLRDLESGKLGGPKFWNSRTTLIRLEVKVFRQPFPFFS